MNYFQKFKAYLTLRSAIQLAEEQYEKDGDRYYVVHNTEGKLLVMCRKDFKHFKRKHLISDKAKLVDVIRECFYYTRHLTSPCIDDAIAEKKRRSYYAYVESRNVLLSKVPRKKKKKPTKEQRLEEGTKV